MSHPNAILDQLGRFAAAVLPEEPEQTTDLCWRSLPIVTGERVEGERSDAELRRRPHDIPDTVDAGKMPAPPRLALVSGPAAVAIHDDPNVQSTHVRSSASRASLKIVSIWSRYSSSARLPFAVKRYSVFGFRSSNPLSTRI